MKHLYTRDGIAACTVAAFLALSCGDADENKIAPEGAGGSSASAGASTGGFGNQPMGGGGMAGPFGGNNSFGGNNPFGGPADIDFGYGEEDRDFSQCLATFCTPSSQGTPCCLSPTGPCGVDYGGGCAQRRRGDNGGGQGGQGEGGFGGRPQGSGGRFGGDGGNGGNGATDSGGSAGEADSGASEGGPAEAGSTDAAADVRSDASP
jgi:hypothetical protein